VKIKTIKAIFFNEKLIVVNFFSSFIIYALFFISSMLRNDKSVTLQYASREKIDKQGSHSIQKKNLLIVQIVADLILNY
jgi:hypothetical protein